jgi:hypothetical protein
MRNSRLSNRIKTILLIVTVAVLVVIGVLIYRSHNSPNRLNVEPHAGHEIDKAKRR